MDRVAIFVDAGYLFAQGAMSISGGVKPRSTLLLNDAAIISELTAVADAATAKLQLLRIYWYDGAHVIKGPTAEHERMAATDNVKVRLGFLNVSGQQKGVDSLIVTDLVELSRTRAISDAVLLSGDEDIRIGVQLAQGFGVRIHLIGIAPVKKSQSKQLRQEADTTIEWDTATVRKFLSLRAPVSTTVAPAVAVIAAPTLAPTTPVAPGAPIDAPAIMKAVVDAMVSAMTAGDIAGVLAFRGSRGGVPREFDSKLLARSRDGIRRDLTTQEARSLRAAFLAAIKAKP